MTPEGLTVLSLLAAMFYSLVVCACAVASYSAGSFRQHPWHLRSWLALALLFALLIVSRLLSLEDTMRETLRAWLATENLVSGRRSFQGPIVAIALALGAAGAFGVAYWTSRQKFGRRDLAVLAAVSASAVMIVLIAMRSISLHAMDRLLYGPLKLNWVGDIGASLVVLCAAIYYVLLVKGKVAPRNPARR